MVISQSVEPGVEAVGRGVGVRITGRVGAGCGGVGIGGRVGVTRRVGVRVGVGHCASAREEHSVSHVASHSKVAGVVLARVEREQPGLTHAPLLSYPSREISAITIPAAITA